MTISPDPGRGGRQPDDRSQEGQPGGGGAVPQPGGQYVPGSPYQPGPYPQEQQAYSPYGQQGQPGQQDPYQVPWHGQPYGHRGGYVYSPYGSTPAGTPAPPDDAETPVARPGSMVLALVLIVVSSLPFLAVGLLPTLLPADPSGLGNPEVEQQLQQVLTQNNLTYAQLLAALRVGAVIVAVLALLYIAFAVLAFLGRAWARIVLTLMTAGFVLLLLVGVAGGGGNAAGLVFALIVVAASLGGTLLLYSRSASRYIASRHR